MSEPFLRLAEIVEHRAAATPDGLAYRFLPRGLVDEHELRSYADLHTRVDRLAGRLAQAAQPGERALLLLPPGLDFVEGFLACERAGLVAVPVPPVDPARAARYAPRLQGIAADSELSLVLATEPQCEPLRSALSLPGSPRWATTTPGDPLGAARPREPNAPLFVQYTSGSTGTPKGVVVTSANLLYTLADLSAGFSPTEPDPHHVSWLPQFHDMGLIWGLLHPLFEGHTSTFMPATAFLADPTRWLTALSALRGTRAAAPDFAYRLCAKRVPQEALAALDLSSWAIAVDAAEPIKSSTLDAFTARFAPCGFRAEAFCGGYGLAEATVKVSNTRIGDLATRVTVEREALEQGRLNLAGEGPTLISSGHTVLQTRVRIACPETGSTRGEGEIGEIRVSGPGVVPGYLGRPRETAETFPDGELRTGDLGAWFEGELYVTGRLKDLLIVRGRNLYPHDLETTLEESHAGFRAGCSAAFGAELPEGEQVVVVAEVRDRSLAPEAVARAAEALIAQFGVRPHQVLAIPPRGLLKTSSGKVQRRAMKRAWEQGRLEVWARWPHAPRVTRSAGGALARVLAGLADEGIPGADPDRRFQELGLDSVSAVALSGRLAQEYGVELEAGAVFEHTTPRELARHLEGDEGPLAPADDSGRGAPLAIRGLGLRLPGGVCDDEGLWALSASGRGAVTTLPASRVEAGGPAAHRRAGWLDDVAGFDPGAFGLTAREAEAIDPQQRLILETAWEAIDDAALSRPELAGRRVGVFVGLSGSEWQARSLLAADPARADAQAVVGSSGSLAAGRLAYLLGVHGPVLTVDTACSSGLVALHLAAAALRRGDCELALVASANVLTGDGGFRSLERMHALSPSGRCAAFADDADGYVRGEGAVALVLTRDEGPGRRRAVLRGTAVSHDGRSNGLTAPSLTAQADVIGRALADAGLAPGVVDLVECHGTGTPLGDPVEAGALGRAYGGERTQPLRLAALKTQVGHLEAAAGLAGLARAVLCLERRVFPPTVGGEHPSSRIPWESLPFDLGPAPAGAAPSVAAVSAFGFSGTNAHVVLEAAGPTPAGALAQATQATPAETAVLVLGATSEQAVRETAARWAVWIQANPRIPLAQLAATSWARAEQRPARASFAATNRAELFGALAAPRLTSGPPVTAWALQFSGTAQRASARLREEPAFVAALARLDAAVGQLQGRPLSAWVLETNQGVGVGAGLGLGVAPGAEAVSPEIALPAQCALGWALAQAWRSWGLEVGAVLGHGAGEIPAAIVAGVLTPEEGVRLALAWGRVCSDPSAREPLHTVLASLSFSPASLPLFSAASGKPVHDPLASPAYWAELELTPTRYDDAVRALRAAGFDGVVECGLSAQLSRQGAAATTLPTTFVPSLGQRGLGLAEAAGLAWTAGARVDPRAPHPPIPCCALPSVAWQRTRHWLSVAAPAPTEDWTLAGRDVSGGPLERAVTCDPTAQPWLLDHAIDGTPTLAGAVHVTVWLAIAAQRWPGQAIRLSDVRFVRFVAVHAAVELLVRGTPREAGGLDLETRVGGETVAFARLELAGQAPEAPACDPLPALEPEVVRADLDANGIHWGPRWCALRAVWADALGARANLVAPDHGQGPISPAALDNTWGLLAAISRARGTPVAHLPPLRPAGLAEVWWSGQPLTAQASATVRAAEGHTLSTLDASLSDAQGELTLVTRELRVASPTAAAPRSRPALAAPTAHDGLTERVVAKIARLLGEEPASVSRTAPLTELGLDSLLLLELRDELAEDVGRELPASLLFDYPTIDAVVDHLRGGEAPQPASPAAVEISPAGDDVAIVGMGCRFPGGVTDPESFWALLHEGRDAIEEVPPDRWDVDAWHDPDPTVPGRTVNREGGFVGPLEAFDARFFGVSAREAPFVDPQGRLLLECTWEAAERAGWSLDALRDSSTGVYVGISGTDYQRRVLADPAAIGPWSVLDTAHSGIVGRLSYWLGLKGPNFPVDTACSSALVALHLARQALLAGECERALVGGVNLQLDPEGTIYFSKLGALSPRGRCRTFDAGADGYVRADGCGVLALRRLSDARRAGDPILAVLRGTAVNQDGRSNGFTAPHGPSQQAVIRAALLAARVAPADVTYVEAHGTGTPLGDPIEVQALAAALGEGRERPLWLGSVKSNIGHAEAAAGVAGVIKAVLCLQKRTLVPSLHVEHLNPEVAWSALPVEVVRASAPWPDGAPALVGVSGFGFSGTNAHAVIEGVAEPVERRATAAGRVVVPLSAADDEALKALAGGWARALAATPALLEDVAWTAARTRSQHAVRAAVQASDLHELLAGLTAIAARGAEAGARAPELAGWLNGEAVDWCAPLAGTGARLTELPTYPYQRRRFWIERPSEAPRAAKPSSASEPLRVWTPLWRPVQPEVAGGVRWEVRGEGRLAASVAEALASSTASPDAARGVLHVLDTPRSPQDLIELRALLARTAGGPRAVITQGAFAAQPGDSPGPALLQAARALRDDHTAVVDLPPAAAPAVIAAALANMPQAPALLAWRAGAWLSPRWVRSLHRRSPPETVVVLAVGGLPSVVRAALATVARVIQLGPPAELPPGPQGQSKLVRLGAARPSIAAARALSEALDDAPHEIWLALGAEADWPTLKAWSDMLARSHGSRRAAPWRITSDESTPWPLAELAAGEAARLSGIDVTAVRWRGPYDAARWASCVGLEAEVVAGAPHGADEEAQATVDLISLSRDERSATLRNWIQVRVGEELELPSQEVPLDAPLVDLGLDSVITAEMVTALQVWCGVQVDPGRVMDLPGIEAVVGEVMGLVEPSPRPGEAGAGS